MIFDSSGNESIPGTTSLSFTSSEKTDTLPPVLRSVSIRDSSTDISVGTEILYTFSEPIAPGSWSPDRITLSESAVGGSTPFRARWVTESILGIRSIEELKSYTWYTIRFLTYGMQDWKLESLRDSLSSVRFRTEDVYDTGIIEGTVGQRISLDSVGAVIVVAREAGGR